MTSMPNNKNNHPSYGWEAPTHPNNSTQPIYPVQPGYMVQPTYPIEATYPVQPAYPIDMAYPVHFSGHPPAHMQTTGIATTNNPPPYTIGIERSGASGTPVYEPGHPSQPAQPHEDNSSKSELLDNFGSSFSSREIRHKFVRKVYLILTVQLLVTLGVVAVFTLHEGVQRFVRRNAWLYPLAYVIFFITYFSLICCSSARRKYPTNLILLTIFTLSMAYLLGAIASFHKTEVVILAVGITAVICFLITMFAIQTKIDFTGWSVYLFVALIVLFIFGIIAALTRNPTMRLLYSAGIVILFSMYLIYDTQMIIGGRKYSLSPEEFIVGALLLYLDVVYIFLGILGISRYN